MLVNSQRQKPLFQLHLTLPKRQILQPSELKEFADDNFEIDENSRKFSRQVENAEGKREIVTFFDNVFYPII